MTTACDSSLLIPALIAQHRDHRAAQASMAAVTAVPGHVLLETYSVLTRLAPPLRITPRDAAAALAKLRTEVIELSPAKRRQLIGDCARRGIGGGAVYDALVAATATEHGLVLLSRDRRARVTYDAIGARYQIV